jgi:hypothetical protein
MVRNPLPHTPHKQQHRALHTLCVAHTARCTHCALHTLRVAHTARCTHRVHPRHVLLTLATLEENIACKQRRTDTPHNTEGSAASRRHSTTAHTKTAHTPSHEDMVPPYIFAPSPPPCACAHPCQVMTSVVELMSNAIGHKQAQQLGQEALRELSGMYDTVDGRPPPAPSPAAPTPAAAKPEAGGAGLGGKSPGKKVHTQVCCCGWGGGSGVYGRLQVSN